MHDKVTQSILDNEKRRAHAKAVLNRAPSSVPTLLLTMLIVGLVVFLQGTYKFEAPMWVTVLLIVSVSSSATNMMDLWATRRRLDAAIALLEQQENSQH